MIWNGSAFVARQAGTPIDVCGRKKAAYSGWTAWRSRQMQKQRRRAEIDQLPAAPGCGKQVAETIGYPTPNLAARKLLSQKWRTIRRSTRMLKPLKMAMAE